MTIGNRGLAGQPTLPYIDYRSYAGVDVFLDLTFLDFTGTPQIPTAITYQVDDLTNAVNLIPATNVVATPGVPFTSSMRIQLPGSQMVMSRQYQGSQLCQFSCSATLPPSQVFTTLPLPSVPNIALLLHGDATPLVDGSNYANALTVVGPSTPVFSTTQVKFGTGSISFPGTSETQNPATNCITTPITVGGPLDILSTSSGDFTIDGWVYMPAPGTAGAVIFDYGDAPSGPSQNVVFELNFSNNTGGTVQIFPSNSAGWSGGSITGVGSVVGAWHYFAVVRNGTTNPNGAVYWDSNRLATFNWTASLTQASGGFVTLGNTNESAGGGAESPFFLDEFRVIKGTALYPVTATTITPPTGPTVNPTIPASPPPVVKSVTIIELCSIQTPGGSSP
jgi:hypothetical protein